MTRTKDEFMLFLPYIDGEKAARIKGKGEPAHIATALAAALAVLKPDVLSTPVSKEMLLSFDKALRENGSNLKEFLDPIVDIQVEFICAINEPEQKERLRREQEEYERNWEKMVID